MPMKPAPTTPAFWMSLVAMANCQPSTSIAPASPANPPQISITFV